jgi:hypothetical protein
MENSTFRPLRRVRRIAPPTVAVREDHTRAPAQVGLRQSKALSPHQRFLEVMRNIRRIEKEQARRTAHIGADDEFLVIEDVARILRCSVDQLRRVPQTVLPSYRSFGRRRIYRRCDLDPALRTLNAPRSGADHLMREISGQVLDSSADSGRERSP